MEFTAVLVLGRTAGVHVEVGRVLLFRPLREFPSAQGLNDTLHSHTHRRIKTISGLNFSTSKIPEYWKYNSDVKSEIVGLFRLGLLMVNNANLRLGRLCGQIWFQLSVP